MEPTDAIKGRFYDKKFGGKDWREKENKFRGKHQKLYIEKFIGQPTKTPHQPSFYSPVRPTQHLTICRF
jgi:hypothetical protein